MPVVVFDTGDVGQRLRATGAGWIAGEMTASAVMAVLETVRGKEERARTVAAVKAWREGEGLQGSCQAIGAEYLRLYRSICAELGTSSRAPRGGVWT